MRWRRKRDEPLKRPWFSWTLYELIGFYCGRAVPNYPDTLQNGIFIECWTVPQLTTVPDDYSGEGAA